VLEQRNNRETKMRENVMQQLYKACCRIQLDGHLSVLSAAPILYLPHVSKYRFYGQMKDIC